jgi:hypothetical protein
MLRTTALYSLILAGVALLSAAAPTTAPTSQPAPQDAATDWLLGAATTKPAIVPASQPVTGSPLLSKDQSDPDQRHGTITLSDGTTITGQIATTAGKPLRLWDEQAGEYLDTPMRLVKSIKAQIVWEQDEPEWRFKESGSDIKINTGKTYPARETNYTIELTDGKTIKGAIVAPLYTRSDKANNSGDNKGDEKTYVLHKRDKGEVGKTLKDLIYVAEVTFDEPGK